MVWLAFLAKGDAQEVALPGYGKVEVITVSPTTPPNSLWLNIEQGQTVVWANGIQGFMSIIFSGGTTVRRACGSPTGFHLTEQGEYNATNLNPGGTASLCFIEKGKYRFLVTGAQLAGAELGPVRGEIVVKWICPLLLARTPDVHPSRGKEMFSRSPQFPE